MAGIKISQATEVAIDNLNGNENIPISKTSGSAERAKLSSIRGYELKAGGIAFRIGNDKYILNGATKVVTPVAPGITVSGGNGTITASFSSDTPDVTFYWEVVSSYDKSTIPDIEDPDNTSDSGSSASLDASNSNEYKYYKLKVVAYKNGEYSSVVTSDVLTVRRKLNNVTNTLSSDYKTVTLAQSQTGTNKVIQYKIGSGSYTTYSEAIDLDPYASITTKATADNWATSDEVTTNYYRYYYGLVSTDNPSVDTIEALGNKFSRTSGATASITTDAFSGSGKVCFAYPASLPDLSNITDEAPQSYMANFAKTTIGGYKVYTMTGAATQTGKKYTFNF